jgi:hypothetical protein
MESAVGEGSAGGVILALGSEKSEPTAPASFSKNALPALLAPYDFSATNDAKTVTLLHMVRSCASAPSSACSSQPDS